MNESVPPHTSIVVEAMHAYAVHLVARESFRDFEDVWRLPRSTRLREDLGLSDAVRTRVLARLRRDIGGRLPAPLAAGVRTIGDLILTLPPHTTH